MAHRLLRCLTSRFPKALLDPQGLLDPLDLLDPARLFPDLPALLDRLGPQALLLLLLDPPDRLAVQALLAPLDPLDLLQLLPDPPDLQDLLAQQAQTARLDLQDPLAPQV